MKRRAPFSLIMPMAAILTCATAIASHAWENIINFETGDASQLPGGVRPNVSIVPSNLPGGGSYALRCTLSQGESQTYCGFDVSLNNFPPNPSAQNLYIRYYVKFEPSWRFATENIYFKSQIIEVGTPDYNAGGRSFLNFNSLSETSADIVFQTYSSPSHGWVRTQRTIRNDNQWHCIESRHLRNFTNTSQGRFQLWYDGELVTDISPIDMGNAPPGYITFGYRNGNVQQNMSMQYDEIVIADHYIGPIGAVANLPPAPPANVRITNN